MSDLSDMPGDSYHLSLNPTYTHDEDSSPFLTRKEKVRLIADIVVLILACSHMVLSIRDAYDEIQPGAPGVWLVFCLLPGVAMVAWCVWRVATIIKERGDTRTASNIVGVPLVAGHVALTATVWQALSPGPGVFLFLVSLLDGSNPVPTVLKLHDVSTDRGGFHTATVSRPGSDWRFTFSIRKSLPYVNLAGGNPDLEVAMHKGVLGVGPPWFRRDEHKSLVSRADIHRFIREHNAGPKVQEKILVYVFSNKGCLTTEEREELYALSSKVQKDGTGLFFFARPRHGDFGCPEIRYEAFTGVNDPSFHFFLAQEKLNFDELPDYFTVIVLPKATRTWRGVLSDPVVENQLKRLFP